MAKGFKIKGLASTIRVLKTHEDETHKEIAKAITTGAADISRDAKKLAPVRFGDLRRSIRFIVNKKKLMAIIGSPLEYSIYQELGTSKMRAQPYLQPALDKNRSKIMNRIVRAIKGLR